MLESENIFHVNDLAVEIREGTILDNIIEAGYALPHSCVTGRCLNCQTTLISGIAEHIGDGRLTEGANATILACQHRARAGLKLFSGQFEAIKLPAKRNSPAKVLALSYFDENYCRLTLALPPNKPLEILPGQYIDLIRDGCRRSYSVAGTDARQNSLTLILSRVEGGQMSDYIFGTANVGDRMRIVGPLGAFYLRQGSLMRDCVFIASGSGIGPIHFMLSAARRINPDFSYRLMWQMRDENALAREILPELGPRAELVLSRPAQGWKGRRGYVQDHLEAAEGQDYYLCGNPEMVDSVAVRLQDRGISEDNIFCDAFLPAVP